MPEGNNGNPAPINEISPILPGQKFGLCRLNEVTKQVEVIGGPEGMSMLALLGLLLTGCVGLINTLVMEENKARRIVTLPPGSVLRPPS